MRKLGIIATNVMARPQRALNDDEAARIDVILRASGLLR
jgi:4-hydroxy-tetrahydrodipicolinate synthase